MFKHILLPLDGSPFAECALYHAAAFAQAFKAQITVIQAVERPETTDSAHPVDPVDWYMCKTKAEVYLDGLVGRLQEAGLESHAVIVEGHPQHQILEFVYSHDVDLIMLSSHGRSGLSAWNVSSTAKQVVSRARTSAMIVRAHQPISNRLGDFRYKRLLVPLDGSQRAECTLSAATTLARFYEAHLLLAYVARRPEMPRRRPPTPEDLELANRIVKLNQEETQKYFEQLQSHLSVDFQSRLLVDDDVAIRLHELAKEEGADLLVLSAHGYSGKTKWPYGSVTTIFIEYGTIPLLIVQDLPAGEIDMIDSEELATEKKGR